MTKIQSLLTQAWGLLSRVPVSGDNVELMAAEREYLRQAYQVENYTKSGVEEGQRDPEVVYRSTRPADWMALPSNEEIQDGEIWLLFQWPHGTNDSCTLLRTWRAHCAGRTKPER